jgi:hypothetical protein
MATQAEIHRCKSEYAEARNVHIQLLHEVSVEDDAYVHAWSLLYIAEIEMCMGAQQHDVQKNIDRAKSISSFGGDLRPLQWCTILCITLTLKDAHMSSARTLLQKALEFSWGKEVHLIAYCLERLCEVSCRNVSDCSSIWATVFLAHSIKFKSRLGINKALQFIANVSLLQGDEDTALSLYTVALDGFTHMDVHQSRAECMLRLGDISRGQGDMLQAVKLWKMARPLFERSSQARQIEHIDERLDVNTQI